MFEYILTKFSALKIRAKLLTVFCVVFAVLLILLLVAVMVLSTVFTGKSIERNVNGSAQIISKGISKCLEHEDNECIKEYLKTAVINEDITCAEFTDLGGKPVAFAGEIRPAEFDELPPSTGDAEIVGINDNKYLVAPVKINGSTAGQLRLAISDKRIGYARTASAVFAAVSFLIVIGAASAFLFYFINIILMKPATEIRKKISEISSGDLTNYSFQSGGGELDIIAEEFVKMQKSIETIVLKVRDSHLQIRESSKRILQVAKDISEDTKMQGDAFEEMSSATEEMNVSIRNIAENVDDLSTSSEETSSSILEMAATIEEVSEHAESLTNSVDETSSATEEMVFSIKEIDGNVNFLNDFISDTVASIEQMDVSIREVEKTAGESNILTNEVAEKAANGAKAVEKTIGGMVAIRDIVRNISETITALGKRSSEIGKIINVIEDIAEQTNLLSLNAAIIAAQAGDEGKGFAVVADEIRGLAERTSSSTKDISSLIDAVQKGTSDAVKSMKEGTKSVDDGVKLSKQAGDGLREILESAQASSNKSRDIARTTREQAVSSKTIRSSVEKVKEMSEQIRKATSEQTRGSEVIMGSMDRMREMTNQVKRATVEQHQGSQLITEAIESITEKVGHIQKATTQQAQGSEVMLASLMGLKGMLDVNMENVGKLKEAVKILNEHADILDRQIKQFRTG